MKPRGCSLCGKPCAVKVGDPNPLCSTCHGYDGHENLLAYRRLLDRLGSTENVSPLDQEAVRHALSYLTPQEAAWVRSRVERQGRRQAGEAGR